MIETDDMPYLLAGERPSVAIAKLELCTATVEADVSRVAKVIVVYVLDEDGEPPVL